jgi:purine-nucleoside phosphorylase
MTQNEAIINPVKGKSAPNLSPLALMVSSQTDVDELLKRSGLGEEYKKLMMSRVYYRNSGGFSLTGPVVSAAYGVMLAETLIVWGARKIIFFGWCGAISPAVKTGDIIVPSGAVIDEGTSRHYNADEKETAKPSSALSEKIKAQLSKADIDFHEGIVWSTDAIYRETRDKVRRFQSENVLAVEMEMSALFTVGRFRNVDAAGILVVSDELSALTWKPGFKNERFRQSRAAVVEILGRVGET